MFDYPHIQLTLLTLMAIFAYFLRFKISNWRDYAFMIILVSYGVVNSGSCDYVDSGAQLRA